MPKKKATTKKKPRRIGARAYIPPTPKEFKEALKNEPVVKAAARGLKSYVKREKALAVKTRKAWDAKMKKRRGK